MSIKAIDWVWKQSAAKSTPLLLLLALADYCNDDGECYPSVRRLAKKCRVSTRRVQQVLEALKRSGELRVATGGGIACHGGSTNRYYLERYRRSLREAPKPNASIIAMPMAEGDTTLLEDTYAGAAEQSSPPGTEGAGGKRAETTCTPAADGFTAEDDCTPAFSADCTPPAETDCAPTPATDFRQTVSNNRHINHHSPQHTQLLPNSACAREAPAAEVCVGEGVFSEDDAFLWASEHPFWSTRITSREALKRNLAEGRAFRAQFLATLAAMKGQQAPSGGYPESQEASRRRSSAKEDYHAAFWNYFGKAAQGTLHDPADDD